MSPNDLVTRTRLAVAALVDEATDPRLTMGERKR